MGPESNFRLRIPTGMVPESKTPDSEGNGPGVEFWIPDSDGNGCWFRTWAPQIRICIVSGNIWENHRSTLGNKGLTTKCVLAVIFPFAELCAGWGERERDMQDSGNFLLSKLSP